MSRTEAQCRLRWATHRVWLYSAVTVGLPRSVTTERMLVYRDWEERFDRLPNDALHFGGRARMMGATSTWSSGYRVHPTLRSRQPGDRWLVHFFVSPDGLAVTLAQ